MEWVVFERFFYYNSNYSLQQASERCPLIFDVMFNLRIP